MSLGFWALDLGLSTLHFGFGTLDSGLWTLGFGFWSLDCRLWTVAFGFGTSGLRDWILDFVFWTSGPGFCIAQSPKSLDLGLGTLAFGLWTLRYSGLWN